MQTDWSAFYAPGPEILTYLEGVVEKWKLMPYIRLQHELVHARYDEPSGKWHLKVRRPREQGATLGNKQQYEEMEDTADVLFTGIGSLSRWSWPDIEGIHTFKGRLVHSADWDIEGSTWQEGVKDWSNKTVGVIGVVRCGHCITKSLLIFYL